jgi:hypothetical protein
MGRVVDLGVKLIDANEVRGVKAQPLNIWGHEAFRKSFIVGTEAITNSYFTGLGFTADTKKDVVAPALANADFDTVLVPIYGANGSTVVGYQQVANGAKPNGNNFQSGVKPSAE